MRAAHLLDRAPRHDDPAATQHDDLRAELLDERELMGRHQHTLAGGARLADQLDDQPRVQRIEPRERLVQDEQRRIADEGGRELNLLLLPLRELFEAARAQCAEIDPRQPLCRPRSRHLTRQPFESREVGENRVDARALVEPAFLRQVADVTRPAVRAPGATRPRPRSSAPR